MKSFKKMASIIVSLAIAVLLMYFVLAKAGFANVPGYLSAIDFKWVVLAVALYTVDMFIRAYRWQVILKSNNLQVGLKDSFMAYNLGNSLNIIIPAKIGDVARSYYLKKKFGYTYPRTLPSTFLDRLFDVVGVYLVILLCSLYIVTRAKLSTWLYDIFILGIVVLVIIFIVMELLLRKSSLVGKIKNEKLRSLIYSLLEAFTGSFKDRRNFLILIGCSVVIWLCEGLFAYLIFISLEQYYNPVVVAFSTMIAVLTKVFPITPGGIGVFEGTMVIVLAMFGYSSGSAAVASTVNHLFMNLYAVILGIYILLRENISVSNIELE